MTLCAERAKNVLKAWTAGDRARIRELSAPQGNTRMSADEQERIDLARAAQRIAREDAAAIFLLTPAWYVGLSQRLRDYEPWGSDYFIIRADMAGR